MVNAARFSGRIREALESSLGRKVDFDKVYFSIFSGPGFSLERVVIGEDPRYGIEPFAFVPELHARLRLDKLLRGEIRFASLQFESPSLNLVKRNDGTWNVVELVERLSKPRRVPLSLFPALEISDGRIDFKFGLRKTVLYISDADLSIYPERSGKVYLRFSGSPARTDRAGMGFGHVRGDVNWYLNVAPGAKQLEADVSLDPSNLSEITTLIDGHDAGVHGTISSRFRISGPGSDLAVTGSLNLNDVHRWDLLPASGEGWSVRYGGKIDLVAHRADLRTVRAAGQPAPLAIQLQIEDFLAHPTFSVIAQLQDAPMANVLPLASRLGLTLPKGADLRGTLNGSITYARASGWSGLVSIKDPEAVLPGVPGLRAQEAQVSLSGDRLHLDPTVLEMGTGKLKISADYSFANQQGYATLAATDVPLDELKPLANSWLGGSGPFASMSDGSVTGQLTYASNAEIARADDTPSLAWSGQLTLEDATISIPGLSLPLQDTRARLSFRDSGFEVDHLMASLGGQTVRASYRYKARAKRTERARIELSRADLSQLEELLSGSNTSENFWSRLRLGRHQQPGLLSKRDMEGDFVIDQFFAEGQPLGALNSHFVCEGSTLSVERIALKMPQGRIDASGTIDLAQSDPQWRFTATAANYPWSGGSLSAQAQFTSTGAGKDLIRNFTATGTFTGKGLAISEDNFDEVTGKFQISFANGWPDLRLSHVEALQDGDEWTGEGLSGSDGRLFINLEHDGQQLHVVSTLAGAPPVVAPLSVVPGNTPAATAASSSLSDDGLKF